MLAISITTRSMLAISTARTQLLRNAQTRRLAAVLQAACGKQQLAGQFSSRGINRGVIPRDEKQFPIAVARNAPQSVPRRRTVIMSTCSQQRPDDENVDVAHAATWPAKAVCLHHGQTYVAPRTSGPSDRHARIAHVTCNVCALPARRHCHPDRCRQIHRVRGRRTGSCSRPI